MRISDWSSDVCSSDLFDERDGLSIRRARKAVRCVGGIESGFAHQRLWIAAQCRDQFREEAQQLGMHEVEAGLDAGLALRARRLAHRLLLMSTADRKSTRLNSSH